MLGLSLPWSRRVRMTLTRRFLQWTFKDLMTHCSIGWINDVVLEWKKISLTWDKFSVSECTEQLSIIKATFLSLALNSAFICLTYSSYNTLSIQLLFCDRYLHGKVWMFLKRLVLFALPITDTGSFLSAALTVAKPVILILLCFPLEHFSDFNLKDLLSKHSKNKPN